MSQFPLLNTGAVVQYPLEFSSGQSSQIIRFLDGADQRHSVSGKPLRRWGIKLEQLNEDEIWALEMFFADQLGTYSTFTFPDPVGGVDVPNCRFAGNSFTEEFTGPDVSAVSFVLVETNG